MAEVLIKIENLGPIVEGKFTLKPLTLFIGQNNAGKTYAARLVGSLFTLMNEIKETMILDIDELPQEEKVVLDALVEDFMTKCGELKFTRKMEKIKIFESNKNLDLFIKKIFVSKIKQAIEMTFNEEIFNLINVNSKTGKIGIKCSHFEVEIEINASLKKMKVTRYKLNYDKLNNFIKLEQAPHNSLMGLTYACENFKCKNCVLEIGENYIKNPKRMDRTFLKVALFQSIFYFLLSEFVIPFQYLPAERSGLILAYKPLTSKLYITPPLFRKRDKTEGIPILPYLIRYFLSQLTFLNVGIKHEQRESQIRDLAEKMEKNLIGGNVLLKQKQKKLLPEIVYSFNSKEIPLWLCSSEIVELAPLLLLLKYNVNPGTYLILEEPESHLHPKSQTVLSKLIVKLMRKNLRFLITTHSEHSLSQFNNLVILSKLDEEKLLKIGYTKEEILPSKQVAVYLFKYSKSKNGFIIRKIAVNEDEGIPQDEFVKVHKELYEELIKIERLKEEDTSL